MFPSPHLSILPFHRLYPPAPPLPPLLSTSSLILPLSLRLPLSPVPSSQDCFKASWSEHKALHRVAIDSGGKTSGSAGDGSVTMADGTGVASTAAAAASPAAGAPALAASQQFLQQGWMFVVRKGQSRSPVMPNFEWTGYGGGRLCVDECS